MFKFETGDTVLFHRGSLLYDAECLKHQQNEYGEPEYYVRCTIRKKEWEGWVAEDKLLVYDPDNLFQQKRMKYAHLRHKRFGNIDWLSETESDEYDSSSADEKSNSIKVNRGMYTPRKYTDNFMIDRGFYDSSEDYDCYSDSNDCSCSSVSSVEHSNGNPNDSSNNPNNGGNNAVNSNNHPDNSGDNSVDPNDGNNDDSGENDDVINSQSSADDHSDEELADGEGGTDSNDDNFFPGDDDDDTGTDNDDDTDTDNNDDDDDHGPVNFDDNSDDSGCSEGSSSSDSSCDCDSSSTEPSLFGSSSSSSSSSDSSGTIDSSNDDSSNGSNNSSSSNDSYSTSNGNSSYESSDNNIHDSVISEESDEPFREEADKNSDKEPVDGEKLVDSDGEETDEDNSEATDDSNNEESDDSNSEETNDSNSEESDDSNSEESDDSNSEETNDSNNEGSDDSNNEGSDDDVESVECQCVDYFPDVSGEDSLSVLSRLDVEMPSTLVKWLVNDWNCVCNGQNLHFLPAKYTIADIIEDYMRRKIYTEDENGSDEDSKSITLDICDGIIKYFNAMLGSKLLYVKERYQYRDVLDEYKGQPLTSVYGGTHLLRLLATLGSMDFRMQIDDTTIKLLHDHIAEMYEYLAARCNALYQYNQYTLIPVSYYRRLIQNQ